MSLSQAQIQTYLEGGEAFPPVNTANHLRNEYASVQARFQVQPLSTRNFLETQAKALAEAVLRQASLLHYQLPARVVLDGKELDVPADIRKQAAGGWIDRLAHNSLLQAVSQSLSDLEGSPSLVISLSAALVRFTAAHTMIHDILPAGRTVVYRSVEDEDIPTIPVYQVPQAQTEMLFAKDQPGDEPGNLQTPYVPYARCFFLPKWVAFDQDDRLLVKNRSEAFATIASLRRFITILQSAVALAPYMVANEEYQRKRYGVLGQLVNQGRALARYEIAEVVQTIQRRVAEKSLNRGLSLSLPYFDDQALELRTYDFVIIPTGRIMFLPAFVVRAARQEQVKVAQDTHLSPSTRKHLLINLRVLEQTFYRSI